ncbi:hypothetical protein K439DRAFT_1614125 [Ramaria rubella]|nr:hypothetical protein K439DRAFT_1614125 [Ramaria rubella]
MAVDALGALTSCRSNIPGEGCGGDFPRKSSAGLCARCTHLETLTGDDIKYEQFATLPQCQECGLAFRGMIGSTCGTCKNAKNREKGVIEQTLTDKAQERSNAFNARISRDGALPRTPATNPLSHINNQPTISMTSDAILQAKQAVGSSRDTIIMVCMDVRYKGKISPAFGATTRSMSESVSMTELHADAVSFVNKYWEKTHDQTLMSSMLARILIQGERREKQKRSRNDLEESDFPKRARSSGPMESSFVFAKCPALGASEAKDHSRPEKLKLSGPMGTIDAEGGPGKETTSSREEQKSLHMDEKTYVAKRFYDIGKGDEKGWWFWDRFKEEAKRHGRQIAMDMQFVEPLLAKEVVGVEQCPSLGSNCSRDDVELSEIQAIYWLLEEQRTPVVNNYSYTLNHPDQKSLKGATIVVFAHFCWLYSQQTLVFADMQGI